MKIKLNVLRAKIRGFQATGEKIRRMIGKTSGKKREALWREKHILGDINRQQLVAYGLIRGIPYQNIERCSEQNKLNVEVIFRVIQEHEDWVPQADRWTLEKVQAALNPPSKGLEQLTEKSPKG